MAITNSPAYPIPGESVTLTRTGGVGTYTEWELTSKPSTSALALGFLRAPSGAAIATFQPDVQGAYGFRAHEYVEYSGFASYPGDPAGAARKELKGSQTGTVYAAATLELPIQTIFGHGATLRLRVHGTTVRAAELVKFTTELARLAAIQISVTSALAALVGVEAEAGALGEDFVADVRTLLAAYIHHIGVVEGGQHSLADGTNVPRREPPYSVVSAIDSLSDLYDWMNGHLRAGVGGGTWHTNDDTKNMPIAVRGQGLAGAVVSLADLRERVYERHRVQTSSPAVHGAADNTGASKMADPLPLTSAVVAYLDALAAAAPTAPSGEQQGTIDLMHGFGFKISS